VCLFCKRLEGTHFVWPQAETGTVFLTVAQLSMLLEGLEWRRVQPSWKPQVAV
jgi:transposase